MREREKKRFGIGVPTDTAGLERTRSQLPAPFLSRALGPSVCAGVMRGRLLFRRGIGIASNLAYIHTHTHILVSLYNISIEKYPHVYNRAMMYVTCLPPDGICAQREAQPQPLCFAFRVRKNITTSYPGPSEKVGQEGESEK